MRECERRRPARISAFAGCSRGWTGQAPGGRVEGCAVRPVGQGGPWSCKRGYASRATSDGCRPCTTPARERPTGTASMRSVTLSPKPRGRAIGICHLILVSRIRPIRRLRPNRWGNTWSAFTQAPGSGPFSSALTAVGVVVRILFVSLARFERIANDALFFRQTAHNLVSGLGYSYPFPTDPANSVPTAAHPPLFSLVLSLFDLLTSTPSGVSA